jgi:hypothetical protein
MEEPYILEGSGAHLTQVMLFKQFWLMSNKKSFVSGLFLRDYLNTALFLNCFAHVLAKAPNKYPYFKHYARNIVLLTPGEHALWDQGTEEARISYALEVEAATGGKSTADWAKLKALEEDLKVEYKKVFPTTIGIIIGFKYTPEEVFSKIGELNKKYWISLGGTPKR